MDPPNSVDEPVGEEPAVDNTMKPPKLETATENVDQTGSQSCAELPTETEVPPPQSAAIPEPGQPKPSTDVYRPPEWAMLCPAEAGYRLEVVKNGIPLPECTIILSPAPPSSSSSSASDASTDPVAEELSFCLLGRQPNPFYATHNGLNGQCAVMAHPSISRLHAVLQYGRPPPPIARTSATQTETPGWYMQDLDSTHGTFINKRRLPPGRFVRIHVGHVIRFGASTRLYLLAGPDDDTEPESTQSWSELKQAYHARQLAKQSSQSLNSVTSATEVALGCDWGLSSEDVPADGATFLANIKGAACLSYEHLYQDDPKRALKAYFDREGIDPEPEFEFVEAAFGKQHCRIELPLDSGNVTAEAIVTGKRKEAIAACALEACRLLDRLGEFDPNKNSAGSSKLVRSKAYWEENDYYSSDEDTFIDRTGQIERKRLERIRQLGVEGEAAERAAAQLASATKAASRGDAKQSVQILNENASKLAMLAQLEKIGGEIIALEEQLKAIDEKFVPQAAKPTELDELEAYMNALKSGAPSRRERMKLKSRLFTLRQTEMRLFQKAGLPLPRRRVVASAGSIVPDDETGKMARTDAAAAVRAAKRRLEEESPAVCDSRPSNSVKATNERSSNTRLKMDQIKRSLPGRSDSHTSRSTRMNREDEPFVAEEDEEEGEDALITKADEAKHVLKKMEQSEGNKVNADLSTTSSSPNNSPQVNAEPVAPACPDPRIRSTANGITHSSDPLSKFEPQSVDADRPSNAKPRASHQEAIESKKLMADECGSMTAPSESNEPIKSPGPASEQSQAASPNVHESDPEPGPPETVIPHKRTKLSQPCPSRAADVYESADPDYVTWVPPSDQQGDGWTALNAKYGY